MPSEKVLISKIQDRFGRVIQFSYECEELSNHIFDCIHIRVSAQTLRRLFGFIKDGVKTSNRTLEYLSYYSGYENYKSLLNNSKTLPSSDKDDEIIISTIKKFYDIELAQVNDINYQRACGNIAKLIVSDSLLFNKLSGFLSTNTVSQIYFFERYPYVAKLSEEYLIHLKRYMQSKKTDEAQLFGNCLFFLSYYLREKHDELPKYLKKINSIKLTDDIHYFPRARKMMSNILYAHLINDKKLLNDLTLQSFEEERKINKSQKQNVFPFYHYIMVDCFILIRDYESAMKVFKIAELDYKSYNDGTIEHGYYEHFDLMKAITYYNLGEIESAKRILKRIDSSIVKFTFQEYHNINRKVLEYNMCSKNTKRKKEILKKEIKSIIDSTGYSIFNNFIED